MANYRPTALPEEFEAYVRLRENAIYEVVTLFMPVERYEATRVALRKAGYRVTCYIHNPKGNCRIEAKRKKAK